MQAIARAEIRRELVPFIDAEHEVDIRLSDMQAKLGVKIAWVMILLLISATADSVEA